MDRLEQRARSRGSRDIIQDVKEESPSDKKEMEHSGSFDNNLQQYLKRNSLAQQGEESGMKDQSSYNQSDQKDLYNQISPSPPRDVQIFYDGEDDLTQQEEGDQYTNQIPQQFQQDEGVSESSSAQFRVENIHPQNERQQSGSFNIQKRNSGVDQGTNIMQHQEQEQQIQAENRRRQSSNIQQQQQSQPNQYYEQQHKFCDDFGEKDAELKKQAEKYFKKQSFEQNYNQNEQNQENSPDNNECNLDELIIEEGNQQAYDSKDQSYDYSKGSSPEKNMKESTNSGIQNYNSYQQKHRLLQKRSNDSQSVLEQQQQPFVDNSKPVQAIKYVPYQPPQQKTENVRNSFSSQDRNAFNQDLSRNIYNEDVNRNQLGQDISRNYQDQSRNYQDNLRNIYNDEPSPQGQGFIRDKRNSSKHESESGSQKFSNERSSKQQQSSNVGGVYERQGSQQDRKQSFNTNQDEIQQPQLPNQFVNNRGSFSMLQQSENDYLGNDQKITEYKERLREKDQILEQMKSFTVQLQSALEKQQETVINLKNENVGLIQQLRETLQPNQESEQKPIQESSQKLIEQEEKDKQDNQLEQYEIVETNMEMSAPMRQKSKHSNDLKSNYDDGHEFNQGSTQRSKQDEEIDDIKRRFYEMKKSDSKLKSNPIEDELYRQIDNLNEIIDKLRKDNILLNEENRGLIQDSHRIVEDQKDLKYRLTNEIEILALQNRKLLQSHRMQQDTYDYSSRLHEVNYKLDIIKQENEELSRVNSQQLEDIRILLQEKDQLTLKVDELTNLLEQRGIETSRKNEQLRFDLAKEYESKLNLKVQEIHYKSHLQIQDLKNKLNFYQQQNPNFNNNYNSLNPNSTINSNINYQNNQMNNYNSGKNTLTKQSNVMSTPNIHNYQGTSINSNNNNNRSINNYNENNNFLNDPQSNIYSQQQLNNTYNVSEWNQNKQPYQQPISRSSSQQDMNERRIVWEICGILRNEQIESLPRIIADMKDLNKNLTKFSDCIVKMVVACHPKDFFSQNNPNGNNLPTLKQSWKWLKNIMEEYMHLKSQPGDAFEQQICQMLQVQHKIDAASVLGDKLLECTIANRVFKKISHILNLKAFNTFSEFEQAIDQLEKEDMASPDKYSHQ